MTNQNPYQYIAPDYIAQEPTELIPQLPALGATTDTFGSNRAVTSFIPPQPVRYREYRRRSFDSETGVTTVYFELDFADLRGKAYYNGPLKLVGHGAQPSDSATPLDRRYPFSLSLVPQTYTTTITNGWGTAGPVCSLWIFNVLMVAIGNTANETMLTATPAHTMAGGGTTDHDIATLAYVTYTPAGVVSDMKASTVAGSALYLHVSLSGSVQPSWYSTAAMALVGVEHANLAAMRWMCVTPAGGGTLMWGGATTVYTRLQSAAIAAAPTLAAITLRAGSWGGWLRNLRGYAAARVFVVDGAPVGSTNSSRIVHIAADGSDIEELASPLNNVTVAGPYKDELFAADGKSAFLYDGERWLLMDWRDNLAGDATIEGYWEDKRGMYLLVRRWNSGATLYTRSVMFWDEATNSAYQVQIGRTDTATIQMAPGPMPQIPDNATNTAGNGGAILWPVRVTNDMRWQEQWQPPPGYNPYWLSDGRPTPPPTSYAMGFESSGTYTGPLFEIEGLEGYEKVTDGIWCLGNINDAGSTATAGYVEITFAGETVRFTADGLHDYPKTNYYGPKPGTGRWYQGQLTVTAARTTADENYAPQVLPIKVRCRAFLPADPAWHKAAVGVPEVYDGSGFLPSGPPVPPPQRRRNG